MPKSTVIKGRAVQQNPQQPCMCIVCTAKSTTKCQVYLCRLCEVNTTNVRAEKPSHTKPRPSVHKEDKPEY